MNKTIPIVFDPVRERLHADIEARCARHIQAIQEEAAGAIAHFNRSAGQRTRRVTERIIKSR